jgi:hypothetical protein
MELDDPHLGKVQRISKKIRLEGWNNLHDHPIGESGYACFV